MRGSQIFVMITAVAINAVVPILVGATSFSFYIAAQPMTSVQSPTVPIAPSPLLAFGHGLGLLTIFLPGALLAFIIPSIVTSVLLAALTSFLPTKSKVLFIAATVVFGGCASALWLYYCTPARGGPFGELAPCAIIGYLVSGTLVCLLRNGISN